MLNDEGGGVGQNRYEEGAEPCSNLSPNRSSKDGSPFLCGGQMGEGPSATSQERHVGGAVHLPALSIFISQPEEIPNPSMSISKSGASEGDERTSVVATAAASKNVFLPRSESYKDQCRVCQQQTEEPLIDLGCRCRGELAKVHRSCIEIWFQTKGSNKCEICQQVAANVPFPEPQPSTNYWVWRVNSAHGGGQQEHEREPFFSFFPPTTTTVNISLGCLNPLWVAFSILIGGLLLDVLISVSLGITSLPVNIITGVLIVLGLAAALQLSLECCQEFGATRNIQTEVPMNPGYRPTV